MNTFKEALDEMSERIRETKTAAETLLAEGFKFWVRVALIVALIIWFVAAIVTGL